jgi:ABC transporter substrate binding protein (PQQ-dependent alcohol dehydrogenase system)
VNATFRLERRSLPPEADIAAEVARAEADGVSAILLDVLTPDIVAAAKAPSANRVALFNIRDRGDALRQELCGTTLFHVIPSQAALTDALAQFVVRRNWRRVLVLVGPEDADLDLARSFERSAKKFGARIVETKPFVVGNDPRNREQTSVALMTSDSDFDVVFLADTLRDFGRYVPYRLSRPRPVIGTEGLQAAAWDPASERYGAPQVNSRFIRGAGRPMSELDWSAWVATKAVAEAVTRASASTGAEIVRALSDGNLAIEMSKGVTGSFRAWDHQLRQPIMLHTSNAVIEFAPLEGFLHERTTLDTLGLTEADTRCPTR